MRLCVHRSTSDLSCHCSVLLLGEGSRSPVLDGNHSGSPPRCRSYCRCHHIRCKRTHRRVPPGYCNTSALYSHNSFLVLAPWSTCPFRIQDAVLHQCLQCNVRSNPLRSQSDFHCLHSRHSRIAGSYLESNYSSTSAHIPRSRPQTLAARKGCQMVGVAGVVAQAEAVAQALVVYRNAASSRIRSQSDYHCLRNHHSRIDDKHH